MEPREILVKVEWMALRLDRARLDAEYAAKELRSLAQEIKIEAELLPKKVKEVLGEN